MALHLVTGHKGVPHVTAADQGLFNASSVGKDDYVLSVGNRLKAQIITNNAVRILDGSLLMNGRHVNLDSGTYLDANIKNGTQGKKRHDIIGVRYEMNAASGVESVSLVVSEGEPSSDTPTDPELNNTDSILTGVNVHDMPLYRVVIEDLTITMVEPLFQVLAPMADIQHSFYKQNLLVNGDFQCNQRGEKSYTADNVSMYTLDMWRAFGIEVEKHTEGVKLTGISADTQGYFTQFIQLGKLKTTTYTISAMVDDKVCTFTITPGGTAQEKNFGKFKISALTTSTWDNDVNDTENQSNNYNNKLKVNICPLGTNTISIKYVDVFEGSIAYPHVKEDFATALLRCEKYIKKKGYVSPFYYNSASDPTSLGELSYSFYVAFDTMANKFNATLNPPKVEKITWNYRAYTVTGGICKGICTQRKGTDASGNVIYTDLIITNASGVEEFPIRAEDATTKADNKYLYQDNPNYRTVYGSYIVTCEPRDK